MLETDLYAPVKNLLEQQGYTVKAEIGRCDVMALRENEAPVIVELKTGLTLKLLLQAIDRQTLTDTVYLAVPASCFERERQALKLLRRLGLGLIVIRGGMAAAELDPAPYRPRKNTRRTTLLLREFARRHGDANCGGSTRRALLTAYRQDALRCADHIARDGKAKVAEIRQSAGVERAASILQNDVYGWFYRIERGSYGLTSKGKDALRTYAPALAAMRSAAPTASAAL